MAAGTWILERCTSDRFPYRVEIRQGDRQVIALRVQDRWPAANRNIFCIRENGEPDDVIEEVERVPLTGLQRRGRRLSVVLDRARNKRCDFLFLERPYKDASRGTYEQIFWQTQSSMRQRRPRMTLATPSTHALTVRIAHEEKYPWRFPGSTVERGRLAAGDYALVDADRVIAVVERKTFENLLGEMNAMPALHQRLLELASYEHHAFVVEAPYEHFLDGRRVHHLSPSFCARAIGEMYAAHPRLRVVFCANRKAANEWTRRYFEAISAQAEEPTPQQMLPGLPLHS